MSTDFHASRFVVGEIIDEKGKRRVRQCFRPGSGLVDAERARLEEARTMLSDWLRPATFDELEADLIEPILLLPTRKQSAETAAWQFVEALADVPIGALELTRKAVMGGKVPWLNPAFRPEVPQLRKVAQEFIDRARRELVWIVAALSMPELAPEPSREERHAFADRLAAFSRELGREAAKNDLAELQRKTEVAARERADAIARLARLRAGQATIEAAPTAPGDDDKESL